MTARHAAGCPFRCGLFLAAAALLGPVCGQSPDPDHPGVLEPVLTATTGSPVRIPFTDQAQGSSLLNLAGPVTSVPASGAMSLTGHTITDLRSPNRTMRDALDDLESAASSGSTQGMQAAAQELLDVLTGQTQGHIHDGFAMLNYNRGAFAPGHVPGEYKMKTVTDSGLTAPGIDGQPRRVWEVTVNHLWYDGQFDSDTFLLRIPEQAHPFDTLRIHFRIYSLETEEFAPTVVMKDHQAPGSVQFPFKGLDSVWVQVQGGSVTDISVDFPPLSLLRGIYIWGWRVHPPRIQFLQPVFERTNVHTGQVELEPRGRSYAERNAALTIDDIGDAAPEKKMYDVAQAVLAGANPQQVLAMLDQPSVTPLGTWQDWSDLAEDQRQLPPEAWSLLAQEGIPQGTFGPYRFVSVFMNNEMYGTGPENERIQGWSQGDRFPVKVINLDDHMHYFRNVDFGPRLHDDISNGFGSGSHSFEIMNFKPSYGAPKVAEAQWRAGWGFRPHLDVVQQPGVFSRIADRAGLTPFQDGHGEWHFGYQFSPLARGGDFVFNPPPHIIGTAAQPAPDRLRSPDLSPGIVIGRTTEGFGVARMCDHAQHPLGSFCQNDLSIFHPQGLKNIDVTGNGIPDVLWFPPFLRNPDPQGGDIIPPTPAWEPFLFLSPDNGTLLRDPSDPSQGHWVDRTYAHGTPVPPGAGLTATIEAPRGSAQLFYQFDDLFHDNAIFSPHPTFEASGGPPAVDVGFGSPGGGGVVPHFSGSGSLAGGGTATFTLQDAAPQTTAWLVYGTALDPIPLGSGALAPVLEFDPLAFQTGPSGSLSLQLPGGGGPAELFGQFAVLDPAAPGGLALSNALRVFLQP